MPSWYNTHPKRINAIELCNKELVLTSEPPMPTSFGGMKTLVVALKSDKSKTFKVMMTDQDVSKAVELFVYSGDGAFTFQPSEKNPDKYASVAKIVRGK